MSRRGVYYRNGIAYIRYQDETGKIVRESTEQRSGRFAQDLLSKRKTEVAEGRHFPSRRFDKVLFKVLLDEWWERHGQHTRSRFSYHLPKVRARFDGKRAREIQSDDVQQFLEDLAAEGLAASTINKYRTILCSTFNFAVRREKYDRNPVSVVPQRKEPPGRDRFLALEEFRKLIGECRGDPELHAFVWLAATTGARKGEILARRWDEVRLDGSAPHLYVPRSKNGRPKRLPLADDVIRALQNLPSYRIDEYVFPADRANIRFKGKREHVWDMRKPFQAACERAGIENFRIHDLRHMATTILFLRGIPEAIIRKLTGHRSRELERYEHLSPILRRQTVELIAKELAGTASDTFDSEAERTRPEEVEKNGGDDGARTRDLRRDRPAF
jgi:integrase